jgi:hypothetical protein
MVQKNVNMVVTLCQGGHWSTNMKITAERKLESTTKEKLLIEIEWDPSSEAEDGLVAYVAASVDVIKRLRLLEELAQEVDNA